MTAGALLEFSRIGFMNMLAFRLRYYTGVITYLINVTIYYFIWRAIYSADPDYAGMTFPQMVTYVAVGWIVRSMYFNNIDSQMATDRSCMRSGSTRLANASSAGAAVITAASISGRHVLVSRRTPAIATPKIAK